MFITVAKKGLTNTEVVSKFTEAKCPVIVSKFYFCSVKMTIKKSLGDGEMVQQLRALDIQAGSGDARL